MRNSTLTHTLRLVVTLAYIAMTLPLQAQRRGLYNTRQNSGRNLSFDASIGAGYSQLGYQTNDLTASTTGDYGLNAHLGVNYFFTTYFGIGIGADFTCYRQSLSLKDKPLIWQGVTDTDADEMVYGEQYDHTLYIYSWKERQQQLYLAPQVMLLSVIPIGQVGLTIEAGVEYAFCLQSSYRGAGDIEHTGYYPKWGLTLYDVAAHGFYRTTDFAPNGLLEEQFSNRQQLAIVGKIGVQIPLTERLDLRVNALCKYCGVCIAQHEQYGRRRGAIGNGCRLPREPTADCRGGARPALFYPRIYLADHHRSSPRHLSPIAGRLGGRYPISYSDGQHAPMPLSDRFLNSNYETLSICFATHRQHHSLCSRPFANRHPYRQFAVGGLQQRCLCQHNRQSSERRF